MSNVSIQVEQIRDYMRRGMPEGAEPVVKEIPILFRRIEELERSLVPFARQGLADNEGKPLIQVYHKDCQTAYRALSSRYAESIKPPEPEYLPAEV
jgi:hypothetical protein